MTHTKGKLQGVNYSSKNIEIHRPSLEVENKRLESDNAKLTERVDKLVMLNNAMMKRKAKFREALEEAIAEMEFLTEVWEKHPTHEVINSCKQALKQ